MKAKPICLIKLSAETIGSNNEKLNEITKYMVDKIKDYHVLVVASHYIDDITIEVFNPGNMEEKGIEEIKQIVKESCINE